MKLYGLIGKSLVHSFSQKYFTEKFEKERIENTFYHLYPLESIDEFNQLITDFSEVSGLNVTIPYKTDVMPFLDEIDPAAQEIGAVNTIKFERENSKLKLHGFNTDYIGFWKSIKPLLNNKHQKALILGTGGSSKAVAYALKKAGIEYLFVSRKKQNNNIITYSDLNQKLLSNYLIIINTTPLGMYPNTQEYPDIPYHYLTRDHILYDLIYNPEQTRFLLFGKQNETICKNGLEMLQIQADYSWKFWNEK